MQQRVKARKKSAVYSSQYVALGTTNLDPLGLGSGDSNSKKMLAGNFVRKLHKLQNNTNNLSAKIVFFTVNYSGVKSRVLIAYC